MTFMREAIPEDYAEATDSARSTRYLLRVTPDNARQWSRVKPDEELHLLADVDTEKEPTWDEHAPQATLLRASTCA